MGLEVDDLDWSGNEFVIRVVGRRLAVDCFRPSFGGAGDEDEFYGDEDGGDYDDNAGGGNGSEGFGDHDVPGNNDSDLELETAEEDFQQVDAVRQGVWRNAEAVQMCSIVNAHIFPHAPSAIAEKVIKPRLRGLIRSLNFSSVVLVGVLGFLDAALRIKWEALVEKAGDEADDEAGEETGEETDGEAGGMRRWYLNLVEILEAISEQSDEDQVDRDFVDVMKVVLALYAGIARASDTRRTARKNYKRRKQNREALRSQSHGRRKGNGRNGG